MAGPKQTYKESNVTTVGEAPPAPQLHSVLTALIDALALEAARRDYGKGSVEANSENEA
jgi:hypothetical protein